MKTILQTTPENIAAIGEILFQSALGYGPAKNWAAACMRPRAIKPLARGGHIATIWPNGNFDYFVNHGLYRFDAKAGTVTYTGAPEAFALGTPHWRNIYFG